VGLILDLAVVALALVVIGSLALLAWTLGVSAVRSVRQGRETVAEARRSAAESEVRWPAVAERVRLSLERLSRRTTPMTPMTPMTPQPTPTSPPTPLPTPPPGEQPDA
jgi:hypothetical protein